MHNSSLIPYGSAVWKCYFLPRVVFMYNFVFVCILSLMNFQFSTLFNYICVFSLWQRMTQAYLQRLKYLSWWLFIATYMRRTGTFHVSISFSYLLVLSLFLYVSWFIPLVYITTVFIWYFYVLGLNFND